MLATRLVLALALATAALSVVPTAAADVPCVVGTDAERCAVGFHWVVCVTEPCDSSYVCVGFGAVCRPI